MGKVATLCGRYWAMDRDNRWERVRKAYDALTGRQEAPNFAGADPAMADYYERPLGRQSEGRRVRHPAITVGDAAASRIKDGDTRDLLQLPRRPPPRDHQGLRACPTFEWATVKPSPDSGEPGFDRGAKLDLVLRHHDRLRAGALGPWVKVAFPKPPKMVNIAGEFFSKPRRRRQFRCAETEKYPHVTFFFNDYREEPFPGEQPRERRNRPKVATYDLKPEMARVRRCATAVLRRLNADDCEDVIVVNFANGDMVGHTGVLAAAIKAVRDGRRAASGAIVEANSRPAAAR